MLQQLMSSLDSFYNVGYKEGLFMNIASLFMNIVSRLFAFLFFGTIWLESGY